MTSKKITIKTKDNTDTEASVSYKIPEKKRGFLKILVCYSLIFIMIIGLYFYSQKQRKENQTLKEEFIKFQKNQEKEQKDLQLQLKEQSSTLKKLGLQTKEWADQLSQLEKKVLNISGDSQQTWLLSEADFWVKMAARKLWRDQDIHSALLLLQSADDNLAKLNQPDLIQTRQALMSDISTLSVLHPVDIDGIILKLIQMSDQVDELLLCVLPEEGDPMEEEDFSVSNSLSEWRKNIKKNWDRFLSSWITIRRKDSKAEPFLSPNQTIYLRENIRSHLLIAAQAAARHQNKIYHQSLEILPTWINTYFDAQNIHTLLFLEDLKNLQKKDISIQIPDRLKSPALLEKWLHSYSWINPSFSSSK